MEIVAVLVGVLTIYLLYDGLSTKMSVISKEIEISARNDNLKLQPKIQELKKKTQEIINKDGWVTIEDIDELVEQARSK